MAPSTTIRERVRAAWPLGLLLLSIAAAALAAVQAVSAVRSNARKTDTLLADYAAFAAWSYGRHAWEELATTLWAVLNPVQHSDLHPHDRNMPGAWNLPRYFETSGEECGCTGRQAPASYFAFQIGRSEIDEHGPRLAPAERAWLMDTVTAHLRHEYQAGWRAAVVSGGPGEWTGLYGYSPMPTTWGDTLIYGFKYDAAAFETMFRGALDEQRILPPSLTRGLDNAAIVGVRVSAPGDVVLYESPDLPDWTYYADEPMDARLGGLGVRVALRPEMAEQLVIGGLPRSRLPLLIGLLVLAAALAVVAVVQIRREAEFARRRSDFVASVSHELRTPLAQVRLFLETLRLGRFRTEEQREWSLRSIDRETLRLAHLVENVLHFSRSGRGVPSRGERVPTDLAAEIRQVVESFEPLAASRRAVLAVDAEETVVAPVEREALRQVLLNLLDNAVKYGPEGQTVTVTLRYAAGRARLTVADQGTGVPVGEREAVWRPFYRGESGAARAVGGTGIGLPIVRDIVEQHGGRVRVEDADGGGAAFVVELPASAFVASPAPPVAAAPA